MGLLDKIISYSDSNGSISMKDLEDVNGLVSESELSFFLKNRLLMIKIVRVH